MKQVIFFWTMWEDEVSPFPLNCYLFYKMFIIKDSILIKGETDLEILVLLLLECNPLKYTCIINRSIFKVWRNIRVAPGDR